MMEAIISKNSHLPVQNDDGTLVTNENTILLYNVTTHECVYVPLSKDIREEFGLQTNPDEFGLQTNPEEFVNPMKNSEEKMWTNKTIVFLIETVKKLDKDFSEGIKKFAWEKVAKECQTLNKLISAKHCETKWKTLKRQYKSILLHNNTSGNSKKKWEYFDILHEYLFKKPEITPIATGSSTSGVIINTKENSPPVDSTGSIEYKSSFSKKRKCKQTEMDKRHEEKMKRFDRFNDLFEKMVDKM